MSEERDRVRQAAARLADAIGARDMSTVRALLAPDFVHRSPGTAPAGAEPFLDAIGAIPGEILSVRLEDVEIDLSEAGALVTGVQHAQVRLDGRIVEDRGRFVDWFVLHRGEWRIRVAVQLQSPDL